MHARIGLHWFVIVAGRYGPRQGAAALILLLLLRYPCKSIEDIIFLKGHFRTALEMWEALREKQRLNNSRTASYCEGRGIQHALTTAEVFYIRARGTVDDPLCFCSRSSVNYRITRRAG